MILKGKMYTRTKHDRRLICTSLPVWALKGFLPNYQLLRSRLSSVTSSRCSPAWLLSPYAHPAQGHLPSDSWFRTPLGWEWDSFVVKEGKQSQSHSFISEATVAGVDQLHPSWDVSWDEVRVFITWHEVTFTGCPPPSSVRSTGWWGSNGIIFWDHITSLGPFAVRCCGLLCPYLGWSYKGGYPSISCVMVNKTAKGGEFYGPWLQKPNSFSFSDMHLSCQTSTLMVNTAKRCTIVTNTPSMVGCGRQLVPVSCKLNDTYLG